MSATTDYAPQVSDLFPQQLRLCLKPADDPPGLLDGAWWPYSRDLSRELPALIDVLDPLWGRIMRIAVNPLHWPPLPRKVPVTGHVVKVGWFAAELDPHKVLLLSRHAGRWDLLVVPPQTDPATAHRLMSAATDPRIVGTASALVEAEGHHGTRSVPTRSDAPLQEGAWEDEGGAYLHLRETPSLRDRTIDVR